MTEYLTISKTSPPFPPYLNFQTLRDLGIQHLQELSGKIWTDYNLHDPGITILEVLCYALTDLGYRNNLDIEDLLALKPGDAASRAMENNFFTPDQILTGNPLTQLDWRKRLIDIDGVRNAWLEKVETYDPAIYVNWAESPLQYAQLPGQNKPEDRFNPRGLYRVWLDLDPTYRKDPCGQLYRSRSPVLEEVNRVLCSYRNLCEDFHEIVVLEDEEIALCTDIELASDADPEDVLVEIYVQVQAFLMPRIQFYTLQALLDKGKNPAEIFAGRPSAIPDHDTRFDSWPTAPPDARRLSYSHGFIDVDELQALALPAALHTSDLYRVIRQVPGVAAVRQLSISNYINGRRQSQGESWSLSLTPGYRPTLGIGIDQSQVTLYKGELPLPVDQAEVKRRYFEQQEAAIKTPRDAYELDLPIPQGKYYDTLADHYSIQHDFPLTYGISEDGLPDTVSTLRKAQAKQLKGYLVFFDQLLANYLAQLAHVRDLFSWEIDEGTEGHEGSDTRAPERQHTYFTQMLDFPGMEGLMDFPGLDRIRQHPDLEINDPKLEEVVPVVKEYRTFLNSILEDKVSYRDRRNRFLDHLLARFAESFSDYALLNYQLHQNERDKAAIETNLIEDKAHFLQDCPALGRDRSRAFNYAQFPTWNTNNVSGFKQPNVSGFKQRVARLLGIEDVQPRNLSPDPLQLAPKDFIWSLPLDTSNNPPFLQSQQTYSQETETSNAFEEFRQLAQDSRYYKCLTYYATQKAATYGYVILDSEERPLTFSPTQYTTPTDRDVAITTLQELLQTNPLNPNILQREAGYIGQIKDGKGQIWLQGTQRQSTEQQAWQYIHDLLKRSEDSQNFHLIDSDEGFYGWKLTHISEAPVLCSRFYPTSAERDKSIDALRAHLEEISLKMEGFHVLEHILLRPRTVPPPPPSDRTLLPESEPILDFFLPIAVNQDDAQILIGEPPHLIWQDPYSFWITVVLPYWPTRFQNIDFRRFVERTLRLEAPAHVALRIAWVGPGQMRSFEDAYSAWLEQLALAAQGAACDLTGALNCLLDILSKLRSVYPEGILYDAQPSSPQTNLIILNQTVLGSTKERP